MSKFFITMSEGEISEQIACLLNKYNKLYRTHTSETIRGGLTDYFVEITHGDLVSPVPKGVVVGCVGLMPRGSRHTLIKHLCVEESMRRRGVANKLLEFAIEKCSTPYVCMTIREDNMPCILLAKKMGFMLVKKEWSIDHNVLTVGRRTKDGCC